MKPSTSRALQALRDAGTTGCTTAELCQPDVAGVRFGARVLELRAMGFVIETERERPGSERYRLLWEPRHPHELSWGLCCGACRVELDHLPRRCPHCGGPVIGWRIDLDTPSDARAAA